MPLSPKIETEEFRHQPATTAQAMDHKLSGSASVNDHRPEAQLHQRLQGHVQKSPQLKDQRVVQKMAESNPSNDPIQRRITGMVRAAVKKLTFDDFIWGTHEDHYATASKYVEKGEKIVEGGKATHTTFVVDRSGVTESLIDHNIRKNGWMDNPPGPGTDFILSPAMDYVVHTNAPTGITANHGHGYPVVRVQLDNETVEEATGDPNGHNVDFYSPFHLQGVEEI